MHETTITAARSYFPNRRDVAKFLETLGVLFRTLRKDFCQIYWKCCYQWGQKNCFYNSHLLDWTMGLVPCIHTTPQTVSAMTTTLCVHAMLIEDLLNEAMW